MSGGAGATPPPLRFFQSLWATEERRLDGSPEAPLGERFERVAADGYHGMALDLGAMPIEAAEDAVPHFARTGLAALLTAFPRTIEELRPALRLARRIGAPFVIVVGQVMPVSVAGMIPVVREWLAMAREEGVPIQFETHRNCITNDLFSTLQLLDAIPEMRLSADLSHYVVDREMTQPISAEYQAMVRRILRRSDSFQGRVATRNQVQVPIAFPQHARWLATFLDWWGEGLADWRARAQPGDEAVFICELGPPEYAITDAAGRELSDRREEALFLRRAVAERWAAPARPHPAG